MQFSPKLAHLFLYLFWSVNDAAPMAKFAIHSLNDFGSAKKLGMFEIHDGLGH